MDDILSKELKPFQTRLSHSGIIDDIGSADIVRSCGGTLARLVKNRIPIVLNRYHRTCAENNVRRRSFRTAIDPPATSDDRVLSWFAVRKYCAKSDVASCRGRWHFLTAWCRCAAAQGCCWRHRIGHLGAIGATDKRRDRVWKRHKYMTLYLIQSLPTILRRRHRSGLFVVHGDRRGNALAAFFNRATLS